MAAHTEKMADLVEAPSEDLETSVTELMSTHADLRAIIDTIPALVWCGLPDGSKEFLNKQWRGYTGLSLEESYGWGWQVAVHPEDLPLIEDKWRELRASGEPGEVEARVRRHDGAFRWFLIRIVPLRDEAAKIVRWYGTSIDIDFLKQTELLRVAEKRTLELIADGASLKDVLTHLCSSIDDQVSPSVTTVLLTDQDGKHLVLTAGPRVPGQWVSAISPRPVTPKCGLCGRAAFSKRRVIVTDVAKDPDWPDEYRDHAIKNGIRAAWSEPILTKDNQVLGTFALYSPEPRVHTAAELALIEGAGRIALIAIERQRSQEALRGALDEIQNSEAKLRRIIDTIPTIAWCNLLMVRTNFSISDGTITQAYPRKNRAVGDGKSQFIPRTCPRCWISGPNSWLRESQAKSKPACGATTGNIVGSCSVLSPSATTSEISSDGTEQALISNIVSRPKKSFGKTSGSSGNS